MIFHNLYLILYILQNINLYKLPLLEKTIIPKRTETISGGRVCFTSIMKLSIYHSSAHVSVRRVKTMDSVEIDKHKVEELLEMTQEAFDRHKDEVSDYYDLLIAAKTLRKHKR